MAEGDGAGGREPAADGAHVTSPPTPLDHAVRALARAGRFYARSWRGYLGDRPDDLPLARPTPALALQALRDEMVLIGFRLMRPLGDVEAFEHLRGEVQEAIEFYTAQGFLQQPERFFEAPPPLLEATVRPVQTRNRAYHRIGFDSGFAPRSGEPGRDRWLEYTANRRGYALMLRHSSPRP